MAKKKVATVKMIRNPDQYPAPHSADVHPAEVENYRSGGWFIDSGDEGGGQEPPDDTSGSGSETDA